MPEWPFLATNRLNLGFCFKIRQYFGINIWSLCLQEAKPYKNDPEILAMTNLVSAYQNNDINDFEKILKQNRETIMDDPFIREHIEDLLRNIRTQVLIKLIKPYTRIKIAFISGELNIEPSDVESLLVSCILESTIYGRIDRVKNNYNIKIPTIFFR